MTRPMETSWLVEETDYVSGQTKFSREYLTYEEAMIAYGDIKRNNMMNTVVMQKKEKHLLQE